MTHTFTTTSDVGPNHQLVLHLPADVPVGPVRVTVTLESEAKATKHTLGDLLSFDFSEMWLGIPEDVESETVARDLRAKAWRRAEP